MTLNLRLTPEIELHLTQRAEQKGISVEDYTLEILTGYLFKKDKQSSLVNLLDSWLDEDDAREQERLASTATRE